MTKEESISSIVAFVSSGKAWKHLVHSCSQEGIIRPMRCSSELHKSNVGLITNPAHAFVVRLLAESSDKIVSKPAMLFSSFFSNTGLSITLVLRSGVQR